MPMTIPVIPGPNLILSSSFSFMSQIILRRINCMLLIGIILGMKVAPARASAFGCFNGNSGSIEKPEDIKKITEDK